MLLSALVANWPANVPTVSAVSSLSYAAILIFFPHMLKAIAVNAKLAKENKGDKKKGTPGYDLRAPRVSTELAIDGSEEGKYIARCQGAHQNSFESFSIFAAAVLVAIATGVDRRTLDVASTVYVISRALYIAVYVNNTSTKIAMVRSAVWFLGLFLCFGLISEAAVKYSA
jgi:uncharacterized MAPEG superfamily protein